MFETGMMAISALLIGGPGTTFTAKNRSGRAAQSKDNDGSGHGRHWLSFVPTTLVLVALVAVAAYMPFLLARTALPIRDVIGASVPMPDFFGSILTTR